MPPRWVTSRGVALLDRDADAGRRRQVDGGRRRRDVERDAVRLGQERHAVGADLVGGVAVGGDAVGADDHGVRPRPAAIIAAAMLSVMSVVSMPSLDSSQAVSRAPWRNGRVSSAKTRDRLAGLDGAADHAERGAVAGRGQRAGVAVRQHARLVGQQRRAVARRWRGSSRRPRRGCGRPRAASRAVSSSTLSPACGPGGEGSLHPLDRPEQVDRGRPGRGQHVGTACWNSVSELAGAGGGAPLHAERQAHRRGHADRRRAADRHRGDGLGHLVARAAAHVDLAARQLPLVDHHDVVAVPGNSREHA